MWTRFLAGSGLGTIPNRPPLLSIHPPEMEPREKLLRPILAIRPIESEPQVAMGLKVKPLTLLQKDRIYRSAHPFKKKKKKRRRK